MGFFVELQPGIIFVRSIIEFAKIPPSLVKQIIISHGGSISVDSVVNEYTRFQIELPVN